MGSLHRTNEFDGRPLSASACLRSQFTAQVRALLFRTILKAFGNSTEAVEVEFSRPRCDNDAFLGMSIGMQKGPRIGVQKGL
jgi:hypothetical protein